MINEKEPMEEAILPEAEIRAELYGINPDGECPEENPDDIEDDADEDK